jgi:hypothetical protein
MKKCIVTKERFKSARYVYKTIEKHNCSCILCVQLDVLVSALSQYQGSLHHSEHWRF